MIKKLTVYFFWFFSSGAAFAQISHLDSLLQLLPTVKADTNAVFLYMDLGKQCYDVGDLKSSANYFVKANELSKELDYLHGIYSSSGYYSFILMQQGLYDSAITVNRETMEIALKQADSYQVAIEKWNIGAGYVNKGFNETGLAYYMESLTYFERENYREEMVDLYSTIQAAYARMDRHEEAIRYGEKSLAFRNDTLSTDYGYVLLNLLVSYYSLFPPRNEIALAYLQKVLQIAALSGDGYLEAQGYNYKANIYFRNNRVDESKTYYQKALAFFREDNYPNGFLVANIGLAKIAMFRNDFKQAEARVQKNLELSRHYGIRLEEKNALCFLWELSAAKHDYVGRNRYKAAADSMQNIVVNETMLRTVEELNIKYETEKKEMRISSLEEEKRLVMWLGIASGGILLLSLTALFFLWQWTVQKKRFAEKQGKSAEQQRQLAEQQVKQLEQEKQLVATQAILDGETQERTRIARDLHDGLGGMLSVIRLNINEMRQSVTIIQNDTTRFDKAIGLLDDSIEEMRRVAHHLMPDALSRFGLKIALTDFLNAVPVVEFNYFGNEQRIDHKLEVVIYRIIHELVSNALKHASASHILVQVVQETDRIAFTVEDNGCGFNPEAVTHGTGLRNIRTRVASFDGTMDMRTSQGNGTEISVELRVTD